MLKYLASNACSIVLLVLCSLNTLLLVQLFAEFLQDPESSDVVKFVTPQHDNDPVSASTTTCSESTSVMSAVPSSLSNWTILWHAPFFSGGGYCSEAWSYIYVLQAMGADFRIIQHGDGVDQSYFSQMNEDQKRIAAASARPVSRRILSVCHSEPGAWSVPSPHFQTSRCPHPQAEVTIGRTMFETDRLPQGWARRLTQLHRIWVPTSFHQRVFAKGGDDELARRLRILPQTVEEVRSACVEPLHSPVIRRINSDSRFKFLSVGKWERRKGWDVLLRAWCSAFPAASSVDHREEVLFVRTTSYHSSSDYRYITVLPSTGI
jgi:hypothetical protein